MNWELYVTRITGMWKCYELTWWFYFNSRGVVFVFFFCKNSFWNVYYKTVCFGFKIPRFNLADIFAQKLKKVWISWKMLISFWNSKGTWGYVIHMEMEYVLGARMELGFHLRGGRMNNEILKFQSSIIYTLKCPNNAHNKTQSLGLFFLSANRR